MSSPNAHNPSTSQVRKHYLRIVVVWAATLAALYAFQQYFS